MMKKRRQREVRRNIFLLCLSTFIILSCALSYRAIVSNAEDKNAVVSYKYFNSITVEEGDTLWSIANTYNDGVHYDSNQDYINEVISINHLSDASEIQVGYNLIIPYYSTSFVN